MPRARQGSLLLPFSYVVGIWRGWGVRTRDTHIHARTDSRTLVNMNANTHAHTHNTHIRIRTHTLTYVYAHTHTRTHALEADALPPIYWGSFYVYYLVSSFRLFENHNLKFIAFAADLDVAISNRPVNLRSVFNTDYISSLCLVDADCRDYESREGPHQRQIVTPVCVLVWRVDYSWLKGSHVQNWLLESRTGLDMSV